MMISRRVFLRSAGAVTLGFSGLQLLLARRSNATPKSAAIAQGFGPLLKDPNGILDLPEGFRYTVFSRTGDTMDDGYRVPGKPDGMAAFAGPNGRTVVVRNHELRADDWDISPFASNAKGASALDTTRVYDARRGTKPCPGGTTNVLFDTATQQVEGQALSLVETLRNCAGGPTPWNTWVTCEETVDRANDELEQDHGYTFEVPALFNKKLADPIALKGMGRFNHEAIAVDAASGIVYQTEDREDGLIYRYIPNERAQLSKGGRLEAMCVRDRAGLDTRNWGAMATVQRNTPLAVDWIPLEEIDSPNDDLRHRGHESGACRFARGEGMWAGSGEIYFACTSGGRAKKGQIWKYVPSPFEGTSQESQRPGTLELFVEPNDGGIIDNADNLTVSPWGDLIVCEDGSGDQFLVGVRPDGAIYKFAKNAVGDSEFAGATFSPDGSTLFVNVQSAGLSLAITGEWGRRS